MVVKVVKGKSVKVVSNFDTIPELDDEQISAGNAMVADFDKLLWSDPGAGKTLTALHALTLLEECRQLEAKDPVTALLLVPPIAVGTWVRWIGAAYNACGLSCCIQYLESSKDKVHPDTTHLIVTYSLISRKSATLQYSLDAFNPDLLICDESDNLTGENAARVKEVFGEGATHGIVDWVDYAWFLTGTPIPKHNDGLWPVLSTVFHERLAEFKVATRADYLDKFCRVERVKYGNMRVAKEVVTGSKGQDELNEILFGGDKPIAIRMKLDLDKPMIKEVTLYPKFSEELLELEAELAAAAAVVNDEGVRIVDPRMSTAMRMLGTETAPYVADRAHEKLCKMRQDGDKRGLLICYWHKDAGDALERKLRLNGWQNVARIDGSTKQSERDQIEADFNEGRYDILLGQIKSMGVAINLQGNCNRVMFAEETYSDAANLQAYQRVWRRGQTDKVEVEFCRTLSELSWMKPTSAENKRASAHKVLDAKRKR